MIKIDKTQLVKFFILAFYLATMLSITLYEWNEQNAIFSGGGSPIYRNLMDCPAYIRRGFDPNEINKIPVVDGTEWVRFKSPPLRVMESPLPNLPKPPFLSPFRHDDEEFTIIIPVEMDSDAINFLKNDLAIVPGIFLAHLGENWEIYFNGRLIHSEVHLNERGQIKSRRTWRNAGFPLDSSLVKAGTNILTFRILGDPTYALTGFFYKTPYYIDDYKIIEKRLQDFLALFLAGIFGFIGIYYLLLFLSIRQRKEIYNFFFSAYSILLGIFCVMRHPLIISIIPDSDIRLRLQNASLMMLMAAFGLFIETLGRGKATKITKIYSSVFLFFSLTQFIFSPRYSDNVMQIWEYTILIYYTYVFFYDVVYFYFFDKKGPRKSNTNKDLDALIFNILIGTFAIFICGIYEILSSIFLSISFSLFVYSAFVVQIGMAFSLSQRFSGMYKQLEKSNTMLEIAVYERTVELEKQTAIAIQANRAKSQFLATMSHEIRTPLNAVIGLSEIVLRRGELPEASKNDIRQVHQSGSSLLGIINDILDISKIEAGSFELIPVEYETASLLSDTVMLNMVRIGSKPIVFALEIDGDFPLMLVGDELRIKQVLNNLLSNAIKYTKEGSVTLTVGLEKFSAPKNEALLRFAVRDTGIGIRKEDICKLFSGYTQLDTRANRKIEGTGLGLEISKKLVEMMGGNIAVESEYGKGSVFTVEIIQGIVDYKPIGEETAKKLRSFSYMADGKGENIDRSWMPYGKVLIVDDLPVNLQIARGLLEPYGLLVDSAESGQKAIKLVKAENPRYDLIFMDHMMPEMDGIEAVKIIRNESNSEYCRTVPIIALTANALVGNSEMFMSKGFNGFIPKPIDIVQLDEALNKFIRDKKGERHSELSIRSDGEQQPLVSAPHSPFPDIPGVDVKKGISMTGGTEAGYRAVLSTLSKNVEERLPLFQTPPGSDTLPMFITQVHALKSSSASIGAAEVASGAAKLEAAGRTGDLAFIREHLSDFLEHLTALVKNIAVVLQNAPDVNGVQGPSTDINQETDISTIRLFRELAESFKSQKVPEIKRLLNVLNRQTADSKVREVLDKLSDQVLMAEFDDAVKTIEELVAKTGIEPKE